MMDRTDRHYRSFLRCISRYTPLYTEMVTTGAVLRGDRDHLLGFDPAEKPLALQLGGDDPRQLAQCARIGADWGYDEINLNVGCPSDRVRQGSFGACLMFEPERVGRAVEAMRGAVSIPVTVKHRIGVDDHDRYEDMEGFVRIVAAAGCDRFIVHARKAWLEGLSPKQNREVPPLRYADVYRLKKEHPRLRIEINGGITSLEQARRHLREVDGVMIGRAAYDDPYLLAPADREFFCQTSTNDRPPTRRQVVEAYLPYVERQLSRGQPLHRLTRHILGLFAHQPGARSWKRYISENAHLGGAGCEVILAALATVPAQVADAPPAAG